MCPRNGVRVWRGFSGRQDGPSQVCYVLLCEQDKLLAFSHPIVYVYTTLLGTACTGLLWKLNKKVCEESLAQSCYYSTLGAQNETEQSLPVLQLKFQVDPAVGLPKCCPFVFFSHCLVFVMSGHSLAAGTGASIPHM